MPHLRPGTKFGKLSLCSSPPAETNAPTTLPNSRNRGDGRRRRAAGNRVHFALGRGARHRRFDRRRRRTAASGRAARFRCGHHRRRAGRSGVRQPIGALGLEGRRHRRRAKSAASVSIAAASRPKRCSNRSARCVWCGARVRLASAVSGKITVDFAAMQNRKREVVAELRAQRAANNCKTDGATISARAGARFVDEHTSGNQRRGCARTDGGSRRDRDRRLARQTAGQGRQSGGRFDFRRDFAIGKRAANL